MTIKQSISNEVCGWNPGLLPSFFALSALLCIQECIIIKAFWQCGNSKVIIISSLPKEWHWDKVISFQKNCGRKFEWEMKKKSFWRRAPSLLFGLFPASCMLLLLSSYIMYPRIYSIERWQLWMTFASTMVARWARLLFSNLAVAMLLLEGCDNFPNVN